MGTRRCRRSTAPSSARAQSTTSSRTTPPSCRKEIQFTACSHRNGVWWGAELPYLRLSTKREARRMQQGGRTRETLLQTLSGCRVQYSVSLGTGSLGFRDRSAIPASVPGPVWLSATGHRACPRVRRRAQPTHPLSNAGGCSHLSSHTHTCDVNHSTSLRYPAAACGVACDPPAVSGLAARDRLGTYGLQQRRTCTPLPTH
jgi:hypothetical protein